MKVFQDIIDIIIEYYAHYNKHICHNNEKHVELKEGR